MLLLMPKVILDANALLMPFQFGINLDAEVSRLLGDCEMIVPSAVKYELRKLAIENRAAKAGLKLSEKFQTVRTKGTGDESVIEAALALKAVVVTNDASLLKRLKELGIPRIRLRSHSHLVLEGF